MPETLKFFVLDATYKIIGKKPIVHLFCRTSEGNQICITDEDFEPYFYVIPKENEISISEKIAKIRVEEENEVFFVVRTEKIQKKFLGKEVSAIKVFTNIPAGVPPVANVIKGWDSVDGVYEYDIPYVRRYLIDKNITPMVLHQSSLEKTESRFKVDVFKADNIKQSGTETLTSPKILSIDIETYSPFGMAIDMEKNPVLTIALYGEGFSKVFCWKKFETGLEYMEFAESEKEMILKAKKAIEDYKPDIITGYFSDGFDLPYLKTRASKNGIKFDLGLDNSELRIRGGKETQASINGLIHLDIFKFIKKVMRGQVDVQAYDLNSVASALLKENKKEISLAELPGIWDNEPQKLEKYCEYNLQDTLLTYRLAVKMMPTIIEMVKIVGLPIYDINRMGFSQLVEWYIMKQAINFNEIMSNKPQYDDVQSRRMQTYEGGFVFEPTPGLFKSIVVFDFRSLYPTIISSHNIGPDTINCDCCKNTAKLTPGDDYVKFWFCEKKKGLIPTLIEDLISRRTKIKELIKEEKKLGNSENVVFLDARQNALKLMANSFYGYLGFFGARGYSLDSAKSVTAWGRFHIQQVISEAQKTGFKVLYSDTDSIFLSLEGKTKEDAINFKEEINKQLPGLMELDYEGFYPSGIFVSAKVGAFGAKKKYALAREDGTLKIRGFEMVRRNWSLIAKEVQENTLNIILLEYDQKKALKYVLETIKALRSRTIPVEKVIIHMQLQKEILDYANKGPHVVVAQRMKNKGIPIGPGTMIKYIVTQGNDLISNRSKLPEEVKGNEYDADYYINNQVIPSVERIFNVLGYSKEDLLEKKEQTKLEGFFS